MLVGTGVPLHDHLAGSASSPRHPGVIQGAEVETESINQGGTVLTVAPDSDEHLHNLMDRLRSSSTRSGARCSRATTRAKDVWCGAAAVRRALGAGRVEEASELCSGDFLEGFYLDEAPGFERWVGEVRRELGSHVAGSILAHAEACVQAGELPQAVCWARRPPS